MTPRERIAFVNLQRDGNVSKAVGEPCAVAPTPCVGEDCPLWEESEGLRRRCYFREQDAFADMMGRRPGPLEVEAPPARGFCGALRAKFHV